MKERIRSTLEDGWAKNDWATASAGYAENVVIHLPLSPTPLSRDEFGKLFEEVHVAFPDVAYTIEEMVAEGNCVAARWTWRATHLGPLRGIPATGKTVVLEETLFARFNDDGRTEEMRFFQNEQHILQQLGIIPSGPPPKALIALMRFSGALSRLFRRSR